MTVWLILAIAGAVLSVVLLLAFGAWQIERLMRAYAQHRGLRL